MTKEDILQALRLTAMGRAGHPLQEELADKLAAVFARDVLPVVEMPAPNEAVLTVEPKRTRKTKAE